MECDYCGQSTGEYARWEITTGAPGDGMTLYPCDTHMAAAWRHVAEKGEVTVVPHNRGCASLDLPRLGEVVRGVFALPGQVAA